MAVASPAVTRGLGRLAATPRRAMAPRIACVVLLAAACVAHGPRWTAAQEAQALGAASSGERQGHTAAHAFDGSSSTYWLSKSPAAGQWLTYTFPTPQTVLQYSLSGSSDVRWVAADGLTAFEVQGSNDGVNWSFVDRRCVARSRAAYFTLLTDKSPPQLRRAPVAARGDACIHRARASWRRRSAQGVHVIPAVGRQDAGAPHRRVLCWHRRVALPHGRECVLACWHRKLLSDADARAGRHAPILRVVAGCCDERHSRGHAL